MWGSGVRPTLRMVGLSRCSLEEIKAQVPQCFGHARGLLVGQFSSLGVARWHHIGMFSQTCCTRLGGVRPQTSSMYRILVPTFIPPCIPPLLASKRWQSIDCMCVQMHVFASTSCTLHVCTRPPHDSVITHLSTGPAIHARCKSHTHPAMTRV